MPTPGCDKLELERFKLLASSAITLFRAVTTTSLVYLARRCFSSSSLLF